MIVTNVLLSQLVTTVKYGYLSLNNSYVKTSMQKTIHSVPLMSNEKKCSSYMLSFGRCSSTIPVNVKLINNRNSFIKITNKHEFHI